MKTVWKIVIAVLCALVGVIIVVSIAVSPIAKRYIEQHGEQLIGRQITMDRLSINIFTGGIRIDSLSVKNADGTGNFVSLGQFKTRVALLKLLGSKVKVDGILFDGLDLNITQSGDQFNFDDIIAHFADDQPQSEPKEKSKWVVALYDIRLRNSHLLYSDLELGSRWDLQHIALSIPDIVLGGKEDTDVGLTLNFVEGGQLKASLTLDNEQQNYTLSFALNDFALSSLLPYIDGTIAAERLDGTLSAELNVKGQTEHLMNFALTGDIQANGVALLAHKEELIGRIDNATIKVDNFDPQSGTISIGRIEVSGFATRYQQFADSTTNFSRLMAAAKKSADKRTEQTPAEQQPQTTPTDSTSHHSTRIKIGTLVLRGGTIDYTDSTLPQPFNYTISEIAVTSLGFDPAATNHVQLAATMQKQGTLRADWTGDLKSMRNQNLTITLHNILLDQFSPYALYYTGFPITDGTLGFVSQNIVSDYHLKGTNKLDIYQCSVGKRDRSIKAEYNIPLRAGLYILKDKDQRININLPVSGDINSPTFSYRKLIIKTLGNLMVKVVTSPARYLGEVLGLSNGDLQQIAIDPLQYSFTSEQFAMFDQLVEAMRDKQELTVTMTQKIDIDKAVAAQSLMMLKGNYYKTTNRLADSMRLELIDRAAIENINSKSSSLNQYADSLLAAKSLTANARSIEAKAEALYAVQAKERLGQMMLRRNKALVEYMTTKQQIDSKRIAVGNFEGEQADAYRGKSCYAIDFAIEGVDRSELPELTDDEQAIDETDEGQSGQSAQSVDSEQSNTPPDSTKTD